VKLRTRNRGHAPNKDFTLAALINYEIKLCADQLVDDMETLEDSSRLKTGKVLDKKQIGNWARSKS
jgi:hypothetical protein